jgi:hypothetical protein
MLTIADVYDVLAAFEDGKEIVGSRCGSNLVEVPSLKIGTTLQMDA